MAQVKVTIRCDADRCDSRCNFFKLDETTKVGGFYCAAFGRKLIDGKRCDTCMKNEVNCDKR